jgi:hypothetical protein
MNQVTRQQVLLARLLALIADTTQIILFPLFGEGFLSPFNDVLDLIAFVCLTSLLGYHAAFLAALFGEELPGLDLIPGWTLAVLYATRNLQAKDDKTSANDAIIEIPPK